MNDAEQFVGLDWGSNPHVSIFKTLEMCMSATTQTITEEIEKIDEQIRATRAAGGSPTALEDRKRNLVKQLRSASTTLSEGKQLLKD